MKSNKASRSPKTNDNNAPSRTVKPGRAGKSKTGQKWRIPQDSFPPATRRRLEKASKETGFTVDEMINACLRLHFNARLRFDETVAILSATRTGEKHTLYWSKGKYRLFVDERPSRTINQGDALCWLADQFEADGVEVDFDDADAFPRFLRTVADLPMGKVAR